MKPAFLDLLTCQRIRSAMDRGLDEAAEVVSDAIALHDDVRRARSIEIDAELVALVEARLDETRPAIEQILGYDLGPREGTGFLRYPPGGFYRAHRDRGEVIGWPAAARRAAAVVLFLNGGSAEGPRDFDGGHLRLYPEHPHAPVEIRPQTGLLVAFPADLLHEVLPVLAGTRDAAVDWFYDG